MEQFLFGAPIQIAGGDIRERWIKLSLVKSHAIRNHGATTILNRQRGSLLLFFALTFALAVPFLVLGGATGYMLLPGLPVAALMFPCPALAAFILVYRDGGAASAKALLSRVFDYRRVRSKAWYVPALLFAPVVVLLSFAVIRWTGIPISAPKIALFPTLCLVFFIGAAGEEMR